MAVPKVVRYGETRLLIDIQYKKWDGSRARLRKDAEVQTMTAARAEEKRYLLNMANHGDPFEPVATTETKTDETSEAEPVAVKAAKKTFAEVVDEFRATFMIADLKVTSRKGYEAVLRATLVPRFGRFPLEKVDGKAAADLDPALTKRKLSRSTRNNMQVVLRSVLRFAKNRGYIEERPANLPKLKQVGQSILEIPSDDHVEMVLGQCGRSHRVSFLLMSDAGLRPNEVRALRVRDVQLRWENDVAVGGFLTVREGQSHGETHTPKTGQREIPISRELAAVLGSIVKNAPRDRHIALNEHGRPWGAIWAASSVRACSGSGRARRVVGVLPSALCDHFVVEGRHSGSCRAADGRALELVHDAAVRSLPQRGPRGGRSTAPGSSSPQRRRRGTRRARGAVLTSWSERAGATPGKAGSGQCGQGHLPGKASNDTHSKVEQGRRASRHVGSTSLGCLG